MTERLRCLLPAALVCTVLFTPKSASADSGFSWWNQCRPGSLNACASISIATIYSSALNETTFQIGLQNLQGSPGFSDPTPYGIGGLSFHGFSVSSIPQDVGALYTPIGYGAYADGFGGVNGEGVGSLVANFHGLGGDRESQIYGCNLPDDLPWTANPQTCDYWLNVTGVLPGHWELAPALQASFGSFYEGPGCQTASIDGQIEGTCATVPEPSSILLVLTGVLGLIAASFRQQEA